MTNTIRYIIDYKNHRLRDTIVLTKLEPRCQPVYMAVSCNPRYVEYLMQAEEKWMAARGISFHVENRTEVFMDV